MLAYQGMQNTISYEILVVNQVLFVILTVLPVGVLVIFLVIGVGVPVVLGDGDGF